MGTKVKSEKKGGTRRGLAGGTGTLQLKVEGPEECVHEWTGGQGGQKKEK